MKGPILLWMLLFGICGVVGYLADIGWMMVVGGIGVVFYIFVWRSNVTTLHLAIDNKWKPQEILTLIKEGADIGARDKQGNTPLHIAARCNEPVIAMLLIDEGADVNMKNDAGNTPLHWAAVFDAYEVSEMLLSCGADVNSKNKSGLTAQDRAISKGNFILASLLRQDDNASGST